MQQLLHLVQQVDGVQMSAASKQQATHGVDSWLLVQRCGFCQCRQHAGSFLALAT
jgi:hypothetical protein